MISQFESALLFVTARLFADMSKRDKNFQRIDVLQAEESVEAKTAYLFEQLKSGQISVSDLMGPLGGIRDLTANLSISNGSTENLNFAPPAEFLPNDAANSLLKHHVHPHDYTNPNSDEPYDLVVIGAGVAGLLSVIVGSWLGKKCALIERHSMGGDCLNTGEVIALFVACSTRTFPLEQFLYYGLRFADYMFGTRALLIAT